MKRTDWKTLVAPSDALLPDAIDFIRSRGSLTTEALAAHLTIRHTRAANLMESMHQRGIVSDMDEAGQRRVIA